MNWNKKFLLQLGLAFTLIYAGISSFLYPYDWIGYVPAWINLFKVTPLLALHGHAVAEIILGLWLLSNWKLRWASWLTALDIAVILLVNGFGRSIFPITFRDVGLLCMAIYLALAN